MRDDWTIYALVDPRDGAVRYVGKTGKSVGIRLSAHVWEALARKQINHRTNWIFSVIAAKRQPLIMVLESGEGADWVAAEKKWIKHFRDAGTDLVNATDGGEGGCNPSAETRAKRSKALKGRKCTPETRLKLSLSHLGKKPSVETKARMSAVQSKRAPASAETCKKISTALTGKHLSAETRAKLSRVQIGRKASEETRKRMSLAQSKRLPSSLETRAKIAATLTGKKHTAERIEKTAAANRGRNRF